jgi:Reverse transcriptase (RNA-dependent DNA polymerase)
MSADIIQKTFEHTTQYVCLPTGTMLTKAFRSPHPAVNIYRRSEDVACSIVYSDIPAIFEDSTAAIVFFGTSYKRIRVHIVYDIKHDGRHKAIFVADGHLTDIAVDSVYSGVVTLWGFRLVLFLATLNGLQLWATDIGNVYLETYTSKKAYIVSGPKFGERERHILVISKALYGLRSSGARWHDRFADCTRKRGFFFCKAEPNIRMRKKNNQYKYIAVYVDNLAIAMKNPKELTDVLEN